MPLSKSTISIFFLFLGAFIIQGFRLRYGLDMEDESYVVAFTKTFSQGVLPFSRDTLPHQASAALLLPLYNLWGQEGVLLFFRWIYLLLGMLSSIGIFLALKPANTLDRFFLTLLCLAPSSLLAFGLPSPSYNNLFLSFFTFGTLSLISEKNLYRNLGLIAFTLAGISYPPLAPVAVLGFLFSTWTSLNSDHFSRQKWITLTTATLLIIFSLGLLMQWGIKNILFVSDLSQSLQIYPSGKEKWFMVWELVKNLTRTLAASTWLRMFVFCVVVMTLIRKFFSDYPLSEVGRTLVFGFIALPLLATLIHGSATVLQNFFLIYLVSYFVILFSASWTKTEKFSMGLSIFGSMIIASTSTNYFLNTCFAIMPFLLIFLYGLYRATNLHFARLLQTCFLGLALAGLLGTQWQTFYRDDGPKSELIQITEGPGKGLFTHPSKAKFIEELQRAISEHLVEGKTVMFSENFPFGYLLTDYQVASPSIWILGSFEFANLNRKTYIDWFDENEAPDYYIELHKLIRSSQQQYVIQSRVGDELFERVMKEGYIKKYTSSDLTIWKKQKAPAN